MQPPDARTGSFSLRVDPASYLDGEPAGGFSLELDDSSDGLVARVHIEGAANLRALYCDLEYDAAEYTPVEAGPTELLGVGDDVLRLAVLDDPGVAHLGALKAHWDACAGFSGDGAVAEVRFSREPFTASPSRGVSNALTSDAVQPYLFLNYTAQRLKWTYYYPGDYNQDGRVNLSDLTPLGRHWKKYMYYYDDDPPFVRRLDFVIDSNRDHRINIQDLTEIGRRFGEGVECFHIYSSANPDADYPAAPDAPSSIAPLAEVPMITAQGEAGKEPVYFDQLLPDLQEGYCYWVRPVFGEAEGTPSDVVLCDTTGLDSFSYHIQPETSADIFFDPAQFDIVEQYNAEFGNPGSWPTEHINEFFVGERKGRILVASYPPSIECCFTGDWHCFRLFLSREPQPEILVPVGGYSWDYGWGDDVDAAYNEIAQLLTWYYDNRGDMDQDGEVLVDDMIQLARLFGEECLSLGHESFDPESVQYMVDSNNDGLIGITDINMIGNCRYNTVTGYNIYAATDPEDAPGGDNWKYYPRPPVAPIGYVTLADDALGVLFVDRLHFSFRIYNPEPGMWIWVQPKAGDELGGIPEGAIVQIPE
jgi:hypothetical protein